MELLYLNEEQNVEFDQEYHGEAEFRHKLAVVRQALGREPAKILDIGGGNGRFMDRLLADFPRAEGCVLDVSKELLSRNTNSPRKHLVCGSLDDMKALFADHRFDLITINWVLHHLVGPTYGQAIRNIEEALALASGALAPGGIVYVAENEYEGFFGSNAPSHIIYAITAAKHPVWVKLAKRYFNTAGVGVCFQSRGGWKRLFGRFGFDTLDYARFDRWELPLKKRLMYSAMLLERQWSGHYALRPRAAARPAQQ